MNMVLRRLAERRMRVLVLERARIGAGGSALGVGGVRQQLATPINIALSQLSLPVFGAPRRADQPDQHGYLYLTWGDSKVRLFGPGVEALAGRSAQKPAKVSTPESVASRLAGLWNRPTI
jgi:glycine/D-amino acid oxidase-like deaminating enzyme